MTLDDVANAIRDALLDVLDPADFDVSGDHDGGEFDVSTDDWTLHFEIGGSAFALFVVDDEPDDPAHYAAVRSRIMSESVERALAEANDNLNGTLSRLLSASGDPFSRSLATAIRGTT
jgi:hypothetical protein